MLPSTVGALRQRTRRIDKLQSDFEKSEIKREANEEIQEKNMQILESNIKEIIADNRAAFEKSLAENRVAFEKSLAETRTAAAEAKAAFERALAENRAAVARNEMATEKLRTTIEKQGKQQMWFIVAVVTLGIGALGLYLQYFQQ